MSIEATAPNRFASERAHFYSRDGSPAYEVPYADPKKGMRATTLRDARKLGLYPSVTSIIGCAYRPGLEKWKQDQMLHAALTLPPIDGESGDDFVKRVREDAEAQAKLAREEGTAVHADLKRAYAGEPFGEEHLLTVLATQQVLREHFPDIRWRPNVSFTKSGYGYGGELDLYGIDKDNRRHIVVDFKGAEFALEDVGKKEFTYDEHIMQLAAYGVGMDQDDEEVECANLFFSRNVPGLVHLHVWKPDEIGRGWKMFEALLQFWQASRSYVPK